MHKNTSSAKTRVGIVSFEPIRLAGLISAFDDHPNFVTAIGDVAALLADLSIHYLILDLSASANWMEVQLMIRRVRPDIRQLVLGPSGDDELILKSIIAGARGYLDSNSGPFAIRLAIEAVMHDGIWAPRRLLSLLIDQLLNQNALNQNGTSITLGTPILSPRERQVLNLIMTARSNREISEELGIEERTVKAYVASLMRKTGTDNRVSLSVQATQVSMRNQRELSS
jgi:DNA-binding NarL/FixJ family response regulator